MWDSLESVWGAARENPNCRAFVVPIPYYDKNPDGSLGQMHYEGGLFPTDVPVFDWREYRIEKRKPDLVFIHNPYDNNNYVTSVYPDFYAENLKKYTNRLVYIPYCTNGEAVSAGLCVNPGTIYADHVIVESEPALRCYLSFFQNFVRSQHLERIFPKEKLREKFLLFGSPKIDKAVRCKKEDYVLPEAWKRRIAGRKVVLYNTSIGGLLAGNEQGLEKMRDVFSWFRQRSDVVLWWRPHPLSAATFASMRPSLYQMYQSLVEWYRKEEIGIYDDTMNLYRALAYTDLHYGDYSSLAHLYAVQGKPILIQNHGYLTGEADHSLLFENFALEHEVLWFTGRYENHLFQMELESGAVQDLGEIPGENPSKTYLYRQIFKWENHIWMVPENAAEFAEYDLQKKVFTKYALHFSGGFQSAVQDENKLYILSRNYRCLVIVNMQDGAISTEYLDVQQQNGILRNGFVHPNICKVGDCLYFSANESNVILEYDFKKKKIHRFEVGPATNWYTHIFYDGENFWLVPCLYAGPIVRWNKRSMKYWEITDTKENYWHTQQFWYGCIQNEKILLCNGVITVKIDLNTMDSTITDRMNPDNTVYCAKKLGSSVFVSGSVAGDRQFLKMLDQSGKCVRTWPVNLPAEEKGCSGNISPFFDSYESAFFYLLYETNARDLHSAVDWLCRSTPFLEGERDCFRKLFINGDGTAGQKILQHILSLEE